MSLSAVMRLCASGERAFAGTGLGRPTGVFPIAEAAQQWSRVNVAFLSAFVVR